MTSSDIVKERRRLELDLEVITLQIDLLELQKAEAVKNLEQLQKECTHPDRTVMFCRYCNGWVRYSEHSLDLHPP